MVKEASCLVKKLSHYVDIHEHDKELLAEIEKSERSYENGTDVYRGGDRNKELFVVKTGWLFSYTDLPDGRRQIIKLHQPGDVIGFPDVALKHLTTTLRTAEDVVLCPFPKSALDVILRTSPKLSALLLTLALRDHVVFIDLLRAMGRMSAVERVGYMLLDMAARLRITNKDMTDTFRLPLTQSQIADYLGLTNVYISKTLLKMEDQSLIQRNGNEIRLLREDDLIDQTDFQDRYCDMDVSWFPPD